MWQARPSCSACGAGVGVRALRSARVRAAAARAQVQCRSSHMRSSAEQESFFRSRCGVVG